MTRFEQPLQQRPLAVLIGRLEAPRPTGRAAAAAAIATVSAVLLVGIVDYADGPDVTFGVFYLIPVIAVTLTLGATLGLATSAVSALAWVLDDTIMEPSRSSSDLQVWNGVLRFAIFSVVVLLLAGLRAALEASRESERRSREFLATAAHQLRTPLAGLRASAEALLVIDDDHERERLLANLSAEAGRVGRLVALLLRMARLDQCEPPNAQAVDIRAVLAQELAQRHDRTKVTLQVDPSVPSKLILDPDATREAIANLVDNARRHALGVIELSVARTGHQLRVTVTDDGPGLPPGTEERAFEPFVTLDSDGGTGLGLAIARGLARREGGDLVYQNGAFLMLLPMQEDVDGC